MDIAQMEKRLRQAGDIFPAGDHDFNKSFGRNRQCLHCLRNSTRDRVIFVDPEKEQSITSAYSLDHGYGKSSQPTDVWNQTTEKSWPKDVDAILLVNVLHEVPLSALSTLISNLNAASRVGTTVFIYEMSGPASIEESYVTWSAEDVFEIFREFGYSAIAVPGRIRSKRTGSWGFPYLIAYLLRVRAERPSCHEIGKRLHILWQARIGRQINRIEELRILLRNGRGLGSHKFEHLHAIHSLANAERQLRSWQDSKIA